ncbi:MAG TPA: hypothetical protein VNA86_06555, partial [bacterium]|nr:hypothetical protein [bacterium]
MIPSGRLARNFTVRTPNTLHLEDVWGVSLAGREARRAGRTSSPRMHPGLPQFDICGRLCSAGGGVCDEREKA